VHNPRQDPIYGLGLAVIWLYSKLFHRLKVDGRQNLPERQSNGGSPDIQPLAFPLAGPLTGPLIIVSNHSAGIDPILIHAELRADIRWMMARDMMLDSLDGLWKWLGVIEVDRQRKDTASAREAINILKSNGIIGIFPEGGLARPPGAVMPFHPGIGLLISKTQAPVLPIFIEGTPQVDPAWASLWRFSRSRIHIMPVQHYPRTMRHAEIVADLETKYREWMSRSTWAR
jgi:1-acyl-sn-glycerol-3-phosphate acyltransferase